MDYTNLSFGEIKETLCTKWDNRVDEYLDQRMSTEDHCAYLREQLHITFAALTIALMKLEEFDE